MSQAAELARRIGIRHREAGYLRLELPAELCTPAVAAAIEAGLMDLGGVRRATVDRSWRRLAVRYEEGLCTGPRIARHLFGMLPALPVEAPAAANAAPAASEEVGGEGPGLGRLGQSAATILQPLTDRVQAFLNPPPDQKPPPGSLQARLQPILASALTEKAIINFLNDLVVFYLIKVHWELITKRWLKDPVAHSNAWLTTFYLIFLLIRYRKSAAKK